MSHGTLRLMGARCRRPGLIDPEGEVQTVAFQIAEGAINALYIVRNPDTLKHLN